MEGVGWRVDGVGWRVEGGGWRVEGGGCIVLYIFTQNRGATRCSTTVSSRAILPRAINCRTLCGSMRVTQDPGLQPRRNLLTPPSSENTSR